MSRIRRVQNLREMESVTDDFITQGYKVKNRGQDSVLLFRNGGFGSVLIHIIVFFCTVWWTFFIGNLLYAVITYYKGGKADEVLLKYTNLDEVKRVDEKVKDGY
jgi:hypothetical protein